MKGLHSVLPIPPTRLALAAFLLVIVVALGRRYRLDIERKAVVASVRGSAQLLAVGYVLGAIFAIERWELVLATLLVMLGAAARTGASRLPEHLAGIGWLTGGALFTGTALGLVFMAAVVVRPSPWYDPQYLVPFAGMILGNSMNGASLAGERLQEDMKARRAEIESRLALGLSGPESVHPFLARALRAAMIPTLNSFAVAGVVQLPGMMTGQILSGVEPVVAVEYQILIFLLLMTSTAVSTLLFLLLLRSRYLTSAHQLRNELLQ